MRFATRSTLVNLSLAAIINACATPAHAGKFFFGGDEHLHVITATKLSSDGKPISLCYKTYTYFLLAGIYTTDTYVLCEGGASKRYWPMPSGAELAKLQEDGMIPNPLPPYKREWFDYVMGYSLWILAAFVAVWTWLSNKRAAANRERQLETMKLASRRIMARMVASTNSGAERATATAQDVYQRLFNEALTPEAFSADLKWVRDEPQGYDGFLGTMGRKLDNNAKGLLIRAATFVVMSDGAMDPSEEQALLQLASKLGLAPKEAKALVDNLRNQSTVGADASPSA